MATQAAGAVDQLAALDQERVLELGDLGREDPAVRGVRVDRVLAVGLAPGAAPAPMMSASSVSRPERGSSAWKTKAGKETRLPAIARSGSSSESASTMRSAVRCTAR